MKDELKVNNGDGLKAAIEKWRLITPALISIAIFMIGAVNLQVREMNQKLFAHLTNHELHMPREQIVSKAEFIMYSNNAEKNKEDMIKYFDKRFNILENHLRASSK